MQNNLDKQYLGLLRDILETGNAKKDRTGTGTISVFGRTIRHKMSEGFPLLTSKSVFTKGVLTELFWFLNGDTNIKYLVDRGVNIWNGDAHKAYMKVKGAIAPLTLEEFTNKIKIDEEFAREFGELGPIYGKQWVNIEKSVIVKTKDLLKLKKNPEYLTSLNFKIEEVDYSQNIMGIVGKDFESNNYGSFKIIKEYYVGNNLKYDIQFHKTNYVQKNKTKQAIIRKEVKDIYYPSVYNVACIGEINDKSELYKQLKTTWEGMISRCYNVNDNCYHLYGGKGIYVEDEWLIFSKFYNDAKTLKNWDLKYRNWKEYTLDKDFFQSNKYSKETCIWLDKKDQVNYSNTVVEFKAISPDGTVSIEKNIKKFIDRVGYNIQVSACLAGRQKQSKGWRFEKIESERNYFITESIDQIQVLLDDLKNNPDSRRLMVNAWNVSDLPTMALPPCHYGFQCYTRELSLEERYHIWFRNNYETGKEYCVLQASEVDYDNPYYTPTPQRELSLQWTQRSVDTPLGLPFNIASYGFLLEMLAQQTNMVAGELIGILGDTHIYQNQVEGVKKQLANNSFELPKLKLNKANSLFEYQLSDFEIINYKNAGKVEFPLSN